MVLKPASPKWMKLCWKDWNNWKMKMETTIWIFPIPNPSEKFIVSIGRLGMGHQPMLRTRKYLNQLLMLKIDGEKPSKPKAVSKNFQWLKNNLCLCWFNICPCCEITRLFRKMARSSYLWIYNMCCPEYV